MKQRSAAQKLLLYVWAYHRIADRRGQRRSRNFSTALRYLADANIPAGLPSGGAESGYLADLDVVWVRRTALPKLTRNAIAAPAKNLFNPSKNVITKLRTLALNADAERLKQFSEVFAEDRSDVNALREHFGVEPHELTFRGHACIGWGMPDDVYWIGTVAEATVWREGRSKQHLERAPAERLIALTRRVERFPTRVSPWSDVTLASEGDARLASTPYRLIAHVIEAIAAEFDGHITEKIVPRTVLVRDLNIPNLRGDYVFWQPPYPSERYARYALRENIQTLYRALAKVKCRPDYLAICSTAAPELLVATARSYLRERGRAEPRILVEKPRILLLTTTELMEYVRRYFWISTHDLDYSDHRMPIMRAATSKQYDQQSLLLLTLKAFSSFDVYPRHIPTSLVRLAWRDLCPDGDFDLLLKELVLQGFCNELRETIDARVTAKTIFERRVPSPAKRLAEYHVAQWILQNVASFELDDSLRRRLLFSAAQRWDAMHDSGADTLRAVVEERFDDERAKSILRVAEEWAADRRKGEPRIMIPSFFY